MSSTTRLLVLGVVRLFQPVHGYDVRRELVSWHVEEWASVAPGSIYNALNTLARDGLLEVVGTKQVGNRPERTAYRLTERGIQEHNELLRDTLWTVRPVLDPLVAAISFMYYIDRAELVTALDARAARIAGQLKQSEYVIAAIDDIETPAHVREMMRLISARMAAELAWSSAFKARLEAGEYRTLGDPEWAPKPKYGASKTPAKPKASKRKPPATRKRR
jgi:DNA-binding PadR family transcriptional regulator